MACQYDLSIRLQPSDRAHDEMPLPHLEKNEVLQNATLSVRDFPFGNAPNSSGGRRGSDRQRLATTPWSGVKNDDGEKLQPSIAGTQHPRLTSGLPRATQLPPIPVSPSVNAHKAVPSRVSIDLDKQMAASELRRRGHVSSIGMAFLVGGAITTAAACYFVFASGPPAMDFVAAPTSTSREGHVMAGTDAEHEHTLTKSPIEPAPPQLSVTEDRVTGDTNLMTRPTSVDRIAIAVEDTKPPIGKDSQFVAATAQGSNCFASASAVRQNHPEAWPSWTLRAPGHEGTKCWHAATRATANDHRGEMSAKKQAVGTTENLGSPP
jgi:hypothetical protein